jgi:hypothetical protein
VKNGVERPPLPPGGPQRLILTAREAAEFLQIPYQRFRELAVERRIPRIELGGKTHRYYAYDLLEWALEMRD